MIQKSKIQTLYWDQKYTVGEIAGKFNISYWTLYNLMNKYKIMRRNRSDAGYNYNKIKPQFEIKTNLSIAKRS